MTTCPKCGSRIESPFDGKTVVHDAAKCRGLVNRPSDKPESKPDIVCASYYAKIDSRPPRGMWHNGSYINRCIKCQEWFIGHIKALQCADCAYQDSK